MKRVLGVCILGVASAAFGGAAFGATVEIFAGGKLRGAFTPRAEPYSTGGPSARVSLFDNQTVKTADGKAVSGFEFVGWREGKRTRVKVFVLLPGKGQANTYIPGDQPERMARREFSSHLLGPADDVAISKMKELGLAPMLLRQR